MATAPIIINNVVNAKGTPQILADVLANRPAPTVVGRLFVDLTNLTLQRSNGNTWQTIGNGVTPVTPNLQAVTTQGNTTNLQVNAAGFLGEYFTDGVGYINFGNNNINITTNDAGVIRLDNITGNNIELGSLGSGIDIISNGSTILINGENGVNINSGGGTINVGTNTNIAGVVTAQAFILDNGTNQQILIADGSTITPGTGITINNGEIISSGGTLQSVTDAGNSTGNDIIILVNESVKSILFNDTITDVSGSIAFNTANPIPELRVGTIGNLTLTGSDESANVFLGNFGQGDLFKLQSNNRGEIQTVNELQLISDLSISLQSALVAANGDGFQVNTNNFIELETRGNFQLISTNSPGTSTVAAKTGTLSLESADFLRGRSQSLDFEFNGSGAVSRIAHPTSNINIEALDVQTIGTSFTVNTQDATGNLPVSFLGTTEIGGIVYLVLSSNGITYNLQLA